MTDLAQIDAYAAQAHATQTRAHGAPYVEHPRAVADLAADLALACAHPADDALRAIALLHDVIEDSSATEADLAARFGPTIAQAVAALSKAPKREGQSKAERSSAYYERLAHADDRVRLVKVADRLHNLSELHLTHDDARAVRYLAETNAAVRALALGAASAPLRAGLLAALDDGIRAAASACGVPSPVLAAAAPAGVYVLLNATAARAPEAVLALADAALIGGAPVLQLRAKGLSVDATLQLARALRERCEQKGALFFVNDDATIAKESAASGVHVGQDDLPVPQARALLGQGALISLSTHNEAELRAGQEADWVAVGPVFASPTKRGHADVVGVAELRRLVRLSQKPVIAIGGLTSPARMVEVAHAQVRFGAVISAVERSSHPAWMVRRLQLAFVAARASCAANDEDTP